MTKIDFKKEYKKLFQQNNLRKIGWAVVLGHIFMMLAVVYTILEDVRVKEWKQSVLGFLAGLILFLFFLPIHQNYVKTHPELIEKFGDPKFEKSFNE